MCTKSELKIVTDEINSELVRLLGEKISRIILFGSYARGDYTLESDVDIMVILNCPKDEALSYRKQISKVASRVGLKNDIMISLLMRDKESFDSQKSILPFYRNIEREGVAIYG